MTSLFKNERIEKKRIKSFQESGLSWREYKKYLFDEGRLSPNFVKIMDNFELRDGYFPEWSMRDFK